MSTLVQRSLAAGALFAMLLGSAASLDANAGTLQVSPNPRDFGNVEVAVRTTSTVVISNSGSNTSITGIAFTGSSDFGATACGVALPIVLADGASCVVSVSFRPGSAGAKSATIVMSNDAGDPINLTLQGTGTQRIALLNPLSLRFAGSTSAVQSLTLANVGSAGSMLSIVSMQISGSNAGDFALQSGAGGCTLASNLASGASCTISVAFTPSAPGVRTASLAVTTNDGIIATRTAHLSGGGAAIRGDFNGDGRADVVWRNAATGENYLYPMDGTTILADEGYLRTVADLTWTMAGIGDFDGDGKADILWRNRSSGQNYIYFMNGTAIAAEGFLRTVADQSWQVVGTGDFDGDGKDDILWRNSATGQNYVYLMDGLQIVGEGYLYTVDQNWKVAGVGDFDADGKADILWRGTSDGRNHVWLMNGTSIKTDEAIRSMVLGWHVLGVGDFNGDGYADILWRSLSTGENYLWPMNGTTVLISEGNLRTVADQAWRIVQVADFDGDGKADILWRNVTTGQTYLYPMDGRSIKPTEGFVRTVDDPNWLVFSDSPSNPRSVGYQLVINEVDYDSVGAPDTSEFIELYNPTATYIPTIGLAVVLVFDGQEYARISLGSMSIPPGGYLVIGNASVLPALPAGTPSILMPNDTVHNGPAAAIALFDTLTNTVVDALAYEGTGTLVHPDSNRAAVISGAPGTYNLVEGSPVRGTAVDSNNFRASLMRIPNGRDTNNALLDWILTGAPTPGAANVP